MVHRCCIASCKINVRQAEAKGLSYHTFPTSNPHRQNWVQAILPHVEKPESFKVVQNYTRICSRHFRNNEYSYDSKKRARLNSSAVPTIFTRKNTTSPLVASVESVKQARLEENPNPKTDKIVLDDTVIISSANGMSLQSSEHDGFNFGVEDSSRQASSMRSPSSLEIDKLAYDFRSSLLTNLPDTLDTLDLSELRLPLPPSLSDEDSIGVDLRDTLLCNVDMLTQDLSIYLSTGSGGGNDREKHQIATTAATTTAVSEPVVTKGGSNKSGSRKGTVPKRKLTGISKTPKKKDKNFGLFSVERFRDSDKDIEYYTGFPSYSHFEAFFNSLETHVEKLKVTDIMHGVADLIRTQQDEFWGPKPSFQSFSVGDDYAETEQKRMLKQGRAMSRIDEFFMTLVRLKRRLPEKIIGHMFLVSQPTVSRVIRAWTMLLFKLFEPIPSSSGIKKKIQHNGLKSKTQQQSSLGVAEDMQINYFTKKGIYVPDSFRSLFRTEVAMSIISSAQSPRQSTVPSTITMTTATSTATTTSVVGMGCTTEGNNNNNEVSTKDDNDDDCLSTSTVTTSTKDLDTCKPSSPSSPFSSYSFSLESFEDVKICDSDLIGSCDDLLQSLLVKE